MTKRSIDQENILFQDIGLPIKEITDRSLLRLLYIFHFYCLRLNPSPMTRISQAEFQKEYQNLRELKGDIKKLLDCDGKKTVPRYLSALAFLSAVVEKTN